MLAAALALTLAAPSLLGIDDVSIASRDADLNLFVTSISGVSIAQVNSADARGLVLGVRAGVRASRPPFVHGAARMGFLPMLSLRHDFGSARTEWIGSFGLTLDLWRLRIAPAVGYGLSARPERPPQPAFEVSLCVGTRLGPAWLGVAFDTLWRFADGTRAMHLGLQLGFEWEFAREMFD
jgi:hypothetical protein